MGTLGLFKVDKKRLLLTSDTLVKQPMIKKHYLVLKVCSFDPIEINKFLKDRNVGTRCAQGGSKSRRLLESPKRVRKRSERKKDRPPLCKRRNRSSL